MYLRLLKLLVRRHYIDEAGGEVIDLSTKSGVTLGLGYRAVDAGIGLASF